MIQFLNYEKANHQYAIAFGCYIHFFSGKQRKQEKHQ